MFGRKEEDEQMGTSLSVSSDGRPEYVTGGITLAWGVVTAAVADTPWPQSTILRAGKKGMRFGTILCRITQAEVQTITISATGGTFTVSYTDADNVVRTTGNLAYDAAAATVEAALRALGANLMVTKAGAVFTLTFMEGRNVPVLTTNAAGLTGGAGTAVVATSTQGNPDLGKFGPYDAGATDGRQTVAFGDAVILERSWFQDLRGPGLDADHPPCVQGGELFRARLLIGGAGQPSLADFRAAFPRVTFAQD